MPRSRSVRDEVAELRAKVDELQAIAEDRGAMVVELERDLHEALLPRPGGLLAFCRRYEVLAAVVAGLVVIVRLAGGSLIH